MTSQIRNAAMVSLLETDFIRRNEPGNLLGNVLSTYLALPGLRGFWPMSSIDENSDVLDVTGQGRTLTNNNSVTYNNTDFLPYAELDGSADYLSRADEAGLDITADLTMGAWVYFDTDTASNQGIIAKQTNSTVSYTLRRNTSTDYISFLVSAKTATRGVAVADGAWVFVAGRYTPSTEMKIWVNDNTYIDTTSIPASANNSTAFLGIGARDTTGGGSGTLFLDGNISLPFLCAYALPDNMVTNLYQQSRVLFEDQ